MRCNNFLHPLLPLLHPLPHLLLHLNHLPWIQVRSRPFMSEEEGEEGERRLMSNIKGQRRDRLIPGHSLVDPFFSY
jgi:hypothetical protein